MALGGLPGTASAAELEAIDTPVEGALRPGRRGYVVRRGLLAADVVGLTFAFMVATQLFPAPHSHDRVGPSTERLVFLATLPLWVVIAKLHGLYDGDDDRADHSTADDLLGVFHLVTLGSFLVMFAAWLTGDFEPTPPKIFTFWLIAIVGVTSCRALCRVIVRRLHVYVQRTIIVGAGDVGQRIARKIAQHPEYGIEVIGFVDDQPKERRPDLGDLTLLGNVADVAETVQRCGANRVIVAFSNDRHETTLALLRELGNLDVRIDVVPRFFEAMGAKVRMHTVEGLPLAALPRLRLSRSSMALKRAFDLVVAFVVSALLLPVCLLIALAIKVDSGGPVLFRQTRMGAGGKAFRIFKFRTMVAEAEELKSDLLLHNKHACKGGDPRMFKVPNDPRTTRVGRVLRRWSLDELPQIINVIRGEMSLVGPRPLILEEDMHVVDWQRRRLFVKPGITGLWQVLGRDGIPFEEMTVLDYKYVASWSLLGDIQLMLRTLPAMTRERTSY